MFNATVESIAVLMWNAQSHQFLLLLTSSPAEEPIFDFNSFNLFMNIFSV